MISSATTQPEQDPGNTAGELVLPRWHELTDRQIFDCLYEVAAALLARHKYKQSRSVTKIANEFYPGEIKPAPIIPRTHSA